MRPTPREGYVMSSHYYPLEWEDLELVAGALVMFSRTRKRK